MKTIFKIPVLLLALMLVVSCSDSKKEENSKKEEESSSSNSGSQAKIEKITFNQAEEFMLERTKNLNQTLMKKKSVNFDGTKIYMFLSVAENGYVCISSISENVLQILAADCGTYERKIQEWNAVY